MCAGPWSSVRMAPASPRETTTTRCSSLSRPEARGAPAARPVRRNGRPPGASRCDSTKTTEPAGSRARRIFFEPFERRSLSRSSRLRFYAIAARSDCRRTNVPDFAVSPRHRAPRCRRPHPRKGVDVVTQCGRRFIAQPGRGPSRTRQSPPRTPALPPLTMPIQVQMAGARLSRLEATFSTSKLRRTGAGCRKPRLNRSRSTNRLIQFVPGAPR